MSIQGLDKAVNEISQQGSYLASDLVKRNGLLTRR